MKDATMMGNGRPVRGSDEGSEAEAEPEGFGEAVAAGSLTLALMVSLAFVGFAWERGRERTAHAFAVELVNRLSADGSDALLPPWSGEGRGPSAPTAKATFEAVRRLGGVTPVTAGHCVVASRFGLCTGDRYACRVTGDTPAGPMVLAISLCHGGAGAPWTFDQVDLTVPASQSDDGNRDDVDSGVDGSIRYGIDPPPPDPVPVRLRRRGYAMPFGR